MRLAYVRSSWTMWVPPGTGGGGGACSGSGSAWTSTFFLSLRCRHVERVSGESSSQRSRNTVSASYTAGPEIAHCTSCHGGVSP